MKFITTFSQFILNETLKTHDIDFTFNKVKLELELQHYDFEIQKGDNSIFIILNNVNHVQNFHLLLDNLNSLLINRHGWYPSSMSILDVFKFEHLFKYDEDIIFSNDAFRRFEKMAIKYEGKYDIEVELPKRLYHLSIQEFESKVLKNGLVPKSKSKISKHLDRIFLCKDINHCYGLIDQMANYYNNKSSKNKINTKGIIYEIDTNGLNIKLYKDPNYSEGYYCIDNIPPTNIKIIDKEK